MTATREELLLAAELQEEYHIACYAECGHDKEADRLRALAAALPPVSVALSPAGSLS
ncbi:MULTISPECIES: hypothetical protein [unclassified Microbispora]|uniref:hypothetical protein n=1 Tax=unclassified Microbispora TaxID=2614687 RepID=UPI00143931AE|nr:MULTISPECIES: hypothetical protein [unclassified Microbispora]NJP24410.1 hypothetical protein [Microbispora sp. CL1-1]